MLKKNTVKEQHLIKAHKMEKAKQDFFKNESAKKFSSVNAKKQELDQKYENKMKELSKQIKRKEKNATIAITQGRVKGGRDELEVNEDDIPLRETDSELMEGTVNRDSLLNLEKTTMGATKNVGFQVTR